MNYLTFSDQALLCAAGLSETAVSKLITNLGRGALAASQSELVAAGVPRRTAAKVAAAIELGKRAVTRAAEARKTLSVASDVHALMRERIVGLQQEVFWAIAIDIRNQIVDIIEVARGSVRGVDVHPREVFRPLIRVAAAGAVLVHNHPSGDPTPSQEDLDLTQRLRAAADIVGIPVIDHVVVATNRYRSIAELLGEGES